MTVVCDLTEDDDEPTWEVTQKKQKIDAIALEDLEATSTTGGGNGEVEGGGDPSGTDGAAAAAAAAPAMPSTVRVHLEGCQHDGAGG